MLDNGDSFLTQNPNELYESNYFFGMFPFCAHNIRYTVQEQNMD